MACGCRPAPPTSRATASSASSIFCRPRSPGSGASTRRYANPSIIATNGMSSEGVGSYWPFATGRRVDQANLLLDHFRIHLKTRYILCPNQHIGAWKVGFTPEGIAREYLARRGGAEFKPDQIRPARSPLLGYLPRHLQVEGRMVSQKFLRVETQPEVSEAGYDAGAEILYDFFRTCLQPFNVPDLDPLGREIITCRLDGGSAEAYARLIPQA